MTPTVSVVIPSYNHEKFIQECIQSVLNQTFQDFEIIITDDASSDDTIILIEGFDDSRIKLFKHPKNMGASIAANNCILNASGKYIAMLNSDDSWHPHKLEMQLKYLETHPDISIVFSKVNWVNEDGNLLKDGLPYNNVFNVENRNRYEWLRHFFLVGNSLCHPSSLIRRDKYFDIGFLNPSFSNLPDLDLWVRFCLKYDIYILEQPLIRFRRINEQSNASGNSISSRIRNRFEYKQILDHFLKIRDPKELLTIFPESAQYGVISPETIPYFLSRIAINSGVDYMMLWGLENIYSLLKDKVAARKLEEHCNFSHKDFIKLSGVCDSYKISILPIESLFPIQMDLTDVGGFEYFLSLLKKYIKDINSIFRAFFVLSKNLLKDIFQLKGFW